MGRTARPLVAALLTIFAATPASAEIILTPFVGITLGGDAPEHRPTFGAGVTFVGRSIGFEIEAGRTKRFFGDSPTSADVTTLTAAFVGGADEPGYGAKPYFLAGAGLLRTNVSFASILDDTSYNNFAILLGGGLNVFFNDHLGVRGDLRYFRRLERQSDIGIIPIASNFDFFRLTIGLDARF
jgi:hypothetical protein